MRHQAAQDVVIDNLTQENVAHKSTNLQQATDNVTQLISLNARIQSYENDKLHSSLREAENMAQIESQDVIIVGINKRQQDSDAHIQNQDVLLLASQVKSNSDTNAIRIYV